MIFIVGNKLYYLIHIDFHIADAVHVVSKLIAVVGTTHSESSASQSQASNQPMLGNG
jgi:hypothetical protein